MFRWVALFAVAFSFVCSNAQAQTWEEIQRDARTVTVFLKVEWQDPSNPNNICSVSEQGTAFIISQNGFALTALHTLKRPVDRNGIDKCDGFTQIKLSGRIGYSRTGEWLVTNSIEKSVPERDAALIKFPERAGGYQAAPLCRLTNPQTTNKWKAFGFAYGNDFSGADVEFQHTSGSLWGVGSHFDRGMSGGPIYRGDGRVVAFVQGGLPNTPQVRTVGPLFTIGSLLAEGGATFTDCESTNSPTASSGEQAAPTAFASEQATKVCTWLRETLSDFDASGIERFRGTQQGRTSTTAGTAEQYSSHRYNGRIPPGSNSCRIGSFLGSTQLEPRRNYFSCEFEVGAARVIAQEVNKRIRQEQCIGSVSLGRTDCSDWGCEYHEVAGVSKTFFLGVHARRQEEGFSALEESRTLLIRINED